MLRVSSSGFVSDILFESFYQGIDGHYTQIDVAPRPHGHGIGIPLFVANYKDVGQFLDGMFTYFIRNLLVPQIALYAEPALAQLFSHLLHIFSLRVGDVQDRYLHRRQPHRQRARIIFDQDADEALHRTDDRAVQHDRHLTAVVGRHVFGTQTLRHEEVDLHGADLPWTAQRIFQMVFDLRIIESTLARQLGPAHAASAQAGAQRVFRLIPHLVGTNA